MNPIAEILIEQVAYAEAIGQQILTLSGLNGDDIIYAFATADTLVINCKNFETTWRFDEDQHKLDQAIAQLRSSIRNVWIEKAGKLFYCW